MSLPLIRLYSETIGWVPMAGFFICSNSVANLEGAQHPPPPKDRLCNCIPCGRQHPEICIHYRWMHDETIGNSHLNAHIIQSKLRKCKCMEGRFNLFYFSPEKSPTHRDIFPVFVRTINHTGISFSGWEELMITSISKDYCNQIEDLAVGGALQSLHLVSMVHAKIHALLKPKYSFGK